MRLIHASMFVLAATGAISASADTVIDNANGYTLNAKNELVRFSAMRFDEQGRITAVGSKVRARSGDKRVDMQGKTVLPGLIDAHGHVFGLGEQLSQLNLVGSPSLAEALKAAGAYSKANADQAWIRGRGWNQEIWKLGRFPTAQELDGAVADRPVYLERVDGHAAWVNSRALQLAGITNNTPDPAGGKIMRDANGVATGVLIDSAAELVTKVMPPLSDAQSRAMLDTSLRTIAAMGLTSVHDAGVNVAQDAVYRQYADSGKLTVRVMGMIGGVAEDFDRLAQAGPLATYARDMYSLRAVKLYSDGALGSRGAALLAPYSDEPKSKGLLFSPNAEMMAKMEKAYKRGYQVNVHAIGDAGNRQLLDAYQELMRKNGGAAKRHRIEHAQVVDLADIPRFKTLGIVPSMQPTHATSDMNMAESRVGPQRIKGAYAWRTFLNQGSRIACGSDFPIESSNPFFGIHAAVTRQDAAANPAGGWYANEAMTLKEAFRCFTLDAAWAGHQEKVAGSLEKGKWADFVVIDQDLFTMPAKDIHKVGVLQTWVAGKQVFAK